MKPLAGVAAICCAMALAACEKAAVEQRTTEMTRSFMAMQGLDYDLRLEPASADPRGVLVVTRSRLAFENGPQIELYQVGDGIYARPRCAVGTAHAARVSAMASPSPTWRCTGGRETSIT